MTPNNAATPELLRQALEKIRRAQTPSIPLKSP